MGGEDLIFLEIGVETLFHLLLYFCFSVLSYTPRE